MVTHVFPEMLNTLPLVSPYLAQGLQESYFQLRLCCLPIRLLSFPHLVRVLIITIVWPHEILTTIRTNLAPKNHSTTPCTSDAAIPGWRIRQVQSKQYTTAFGAVSLQAQPQLYGTL